MRSDEDVDFQLCGCRFRNTCALKVTFCATSLATNEIKWHPCMYMMAPLRLTTVSSLSEFLIRGRPRAQGPSGSHPLYFLPPNLIQGLFNLVIMLHLTDDENPLIAFLPFSTSASQLQLRNLTEPPLLPLSPVLFSL